MINFKINQEYNQNCEDSKCRRQTLAEVRRPVPILFHLRDYLVHRVADQDDEVNHQQGPEHVDLEGFEQSANYGEQERRGHPLPNLKLVHL